MRLDFLGAFDPYLAASRLRTGPSADSFLGNLHIVAFVPQICYRRFGCSQPPLHDHTPVTRCAELSGRTRNLSCRISEEPPSREARDFLGICEGEESWLSQRSLSD